MNFTTLWHSMGAGMMVGIVYGILFAVLQTRSLFFKRKEAISGIIFMRTFGFFGFHFVMRQFLKTINLGVYAAFLFIFFIISVQLYVHFTTKSSD